MPINRRNRLEQARLAYHPAVAPVSRPLHRWDARRIRFDRCPDTLVVHIFQETRLTLSLADLLMLEASYDALLEDVGSHIPAADLGWRMDTWFIGANRIRYDLRRLHETGLIDHHVYALVDYFRINAAGIDTLNALYTSSVF